MPDKKMVRECAKLEVEEILNKKKRIYLTEVVKLQEQLEFQTEQLKILNDCADLMNNKIEDESKMTDIINAVINNPSIKGIISMILCSECKLPLHLVDRIINEIPNSKKVEFIKTVLYSRDDFPTEYKDKLESYLVANELIKKSSNNSVPSFDSFF